MPHRQALCPAPARPLQVRAAPMFQATRHELERLRCSGCGTVFTAPAPPALAHGKYAPSVGVMLALMRYGAGQPLYRQAKCQTWFGVPLPAGVQWDLLAAAAPAPTAVYQALIGVAAQAALLQNDDTTNRIQSLRLRDRATPRADGRTGIFTTSIIAHPAAQPVALFFTGTRHAGENLGALLQRRAAEHGPPLQMCDALSRNHPANQATVLCYCLLHGRRNFVDLLPQWPAEGRQVIASLREVYRWEARARTERLTAAERLTLHQTHSAPVLAELKAWLTAQQAGRQVEPNSSLGKAIAYLLNHWAPLTRFLEVPGAPLDNNACERAIKMAILHRKNSLSYKTEHGARVGDVFMSLITPAPSGGSTRMSICWPCKSTPRPCSRDPPPGCRGTIPSRLPPPTESAAAAWGQKKPLFFAPRTQELAAPWECGSRAGSGGHRVDHGNLPSLGHQPAGIPDRGIAQARQLVHQPGRRTDAHRLEGGQGQAELTCRSA